jgi:hypothetical protein
MENKTLDNVDIEDVKKKVKDVVVFGNGDAMQLLFKASSKEEGWMKSTKAMEIHGVGCVVQSTTQQRNVDGSYSLAEAMVFVPRVRITNDEKNGGKMLV